MKLQFKHQKFQTDAAKAVVDVFAGQPYGTPTYMIDKGFQSGQIQMEMEDAFTGWNNMLLVPELSDQLILEHISKIQRTQQIEPSKKLEGRYNLTIEMETGVGKTYTYIKTMYELNKAYGWTKFIVVVPSIAIREGVYKSFEITQDHFAEEYGKKIRFFIYNSKNLTEIDRFASDNAINVMIINSQAFNAKGKDARRIYMKLDEFRSRRPIDIIAKTNPILIIDEPQSVEGKQTKERLKEFNPLFTLRYSATPREYYNLIYRLDAMDAYNKQLVKKIAVKGITQSGDTATTSYVYLESINLSKHALEVLEEQMKRYERGTALGMWDFAAYVVSEDQNVANNVAHTYLALTQGEESYMSSSAINLWRGDMGEASGDAKEIVEYIKELRHPLFGMNPGLIEQDSDLLVYPSVVTATTSLSGKELAYSLNFPQKSVSGLPVIECAEFGRNITTYDNSETRNQDFHIGNIFHMNHEEPVGVELSKNSLSSHAFITGSTGSGKSNTIYRILSEALEADVKFLVVEPAKGEYKDVFGMDEDVFVYGTNPKIAPLLRMNPFSFPPDIHVLEHIDRLVEIFNVCWPMYAAMPAVLKDAIEKSYVDCGWDLMTSENRYSDDLFPSFGDVARNIKTIIDTSEYDKENKGAYKGSLLTRLQSLTTGINGIIFSPDEVSGKDLFDRNVIVDLSRVGSTETKSLIMGMLVLKLQEYRMTEGVPMNSDLRHLTVLEEAHNILRRTAIEQPTESSNILGKSVEMIANAIAEMRTYGEGFIIADQAPGLMDMSVIRNTNTKIIMRLPDRGDRELVGKAANLDENQIDELAKLPRGVAAIYQNEWIQPILCKVERYSGGGEKYVFDPTVNSAVIRNNAEVSDSLLKCIMDNELFQKGDKEDLRELKSLIMRSGLDSLVKVDFLDYLDAEREKGLDSLRCLVYDFLKAEEAIQDSTQYDDIHEWVEAVVEKLDPSIKDYSKKQIDLTMALILHEQTIRDISYRAIYHSFTEAYRKGGGVF